MRWRTLPIEGVTLFYMSWTGRLLEVWFVVLIAVTALIKSPLTWFGNN